MNISIFIIGLILVLVSFKKLKAKIKNSGVKTILPLLKQAKKRTKKCFLDQPSLKRKCANSCKLTSKEFYLKNGFVEKSTIETIIINSEAIRSIPMTKNL